MPADDSTEGSVKPQLLLTWVVSALAALSILLIGSALAGPFGLTIMGMGALLLSAPLAIIVAGTSAVTRSMEPSLTFALVTIVIGWLAALATAALLGVLIGALPDPMNSDFSPFFTWLVLLAPFVCIGIAVATVVHIVRWRRYRRQPGGL